MRKTAILFQVTVVTAMLAIRPAASPVVVIKVNPQVTYAPANLFVRATVEVGEANRSLEVSAESDEFFRSSTIPLDGESARRVSIMQFHGLPAGAYEVRATVRGSSGQEIARSEARVNVIESTADR